MAWMAWMASMAHAWRASVAPAMCVNPKQNDFFGGVGLTMPIGSSIMNLWI